MNMVEKMVVEWS